MMVMMMCTVIDERRSWTDTERDWVNNSDSSSARRVADGPTTAGRAATRAGCCMTSTHVQTEKAEGNIQTTQGREKQRSAAAPVRDAGPLRSERQRATR